MNSPDTGRASRLLSPEQIQAGLAAGLPAWRLEAGQLQRSIATSGWKSTLMAANAIAHLAEVAWHHPELLLSYARVDIRLSTHDAGGVTAKDLALAERIESLLMWRPGSEPGSVLSGTPDEPGLRHIAYD